MESRNPRTIANIANPVDKIIYRQLSYRIQGILFSIQKQLGGNYQEKYYQRAIEKLLRQEKIPFQRELPVIISIAGDKIGHHFLDFLIDEKIVLEIKQGRKPTYSDIRQILMYLKTTGKKLGIIAAFSFSRGYYSASGQSRCP